MRRIMIESPLLEKWLRIAFMDDDCKIFLPCGAFGNELEAMLCTSYDGAPTLQCQGHIYAPASWLAREHPQFAKTIDTIVTNITMKMCSE